MANILSFIGDIFSSTQRDQKIFLGVNEASEMSGLNVSQSQLLFEHLRIPESIRDQRCRRLFTGEEVFLHKLAYNRVAFIKLQSFLSLRRGPKAVHLYN